jgi:hypothetical protein
VLKGHPYLHHERAGHAGPSGDRGLQLSRRRLRLLPLSLAATDVILVLDLVLVHAMADTGYKALYPVSLGAPPGSVAAPYRSIFRTTDRVAI